MLRQNCFAYIHGHSAGGMETELTEAMASGYAIYLTITSDSEFLGNNDLSFSSDSELGKINSAKRATSSLYYR